VKLCVFGMIKITTGWAQSRIAELRSAPAGVGVKKLRLSGFFLRARLLQDSLPKEPILKREQSKGCDLHLVQIVNGLHRAY